MGWGIVELGLGLLLHELCQIYLSLIGTIDKNQITANLSTYSAPCGMMSESTALVNSFLLDYGFEFPGTTRKQQKQVCF